MDSELSEFELVLLEAHLGRCDDCRAFGQTITGLTETLRSVPMEEPSVSFQPPRIRTRFDMLFTGALRAGSAAAAVAVVALTGLIAFNGSSTAIPAVDIEQARSLLSLHEQQLQPLRSRGLSLEGGFKGKKDGNATRRDRQGWLNAFSGLALSA